MTSKSLPKGTLIIFTWSKWMNLLSIRTNDAKTLPISLRTSSYIFLSFAGHLAMHAAAIAVLRTLSFFEELCDLSSVRSLYIAFRELIKIFS